MAEKTKLEIFLDDVCNNYQCYQNNSRRGISNSIAVGFNFIPPEQNNPHSIFYVRYEKKYVKHQGIINMRDYSIELIVSGDAPRNMLSVNFTSKNSTALNYLNEVLLNLSPDVVKMLGRFSSLPEGELVADMPNSEESYKIISQIVDALITKGCPIK